MKILYTHAPVIPQGYTGDLKHFNRWQKHLQAQLDKIKKTTLAKRLIA